MKESGSILDRIRHEGKQRSDNPCRTSDPGVRFRALYLSTVDLFEISRLSQHIVPIYSADLKCRAILAGERMAIGEPEKVDNLYWLLKGKKGG